MSGCQDSPEIDEYWDYYSEILPKLPEQLRVLETEHTLHDSKVKAILTNFPDSCVAINLTGWDKSLNYPVNYKIKFNDVVEFNQEFSGEDCTDQGDIGYWEYEILDNNIEMRILFSSGTEFNIIFSDFEFSHETIKT